jgi:uncharacterized protein YwgA/DNA-binding HxlR family transcriptional regulator
MSFDVIRKEKAVDILLALDKGAKGIREIQEAVGGSNSTILHRINEMRLEDLVQAEYLSDEEYGEIPRNKRLIRLADKGKVAVNSLIEAGFVKPLVLKKDRQKWIMCILEMLGTVSGKTRIMKLLFLLRFEFGARRGNFFRFKAWLYGPYSDEVSKDLGEIENQGLIIKRNIPYKIENAREEHILYEYALTDVGKSIAHELLLSLKQDEVDAICRLKRFNQMTLNELIAHVYRLYPRYTTKSGILKKVLGKSSPSE